jgi:hypothetical protein
MKIAPGDRAVTISPRHQAGPVVPYRSTNPESIAGRFVALPAIHPVMYIHCVIRVSFG